MADIILGMDIDTDEGGDPAEAAQRFMRTVIEGACEIWVQVDMQNGKPAVWVLVHPGRKTIKCEVSE